MTILRLLFSIILLYNEHAGKSILGGNVETRPWRGLNKIMKINESIFKAYDYRGIYPSEINEEIFERAGRAFVRFLFVKTHCNASLLLGWDMRVSSPQLKDAFIRGATKQGANVIFLGLVSTDTVYFASGKYNLPGAMITASHNPAEYNGVKFCGPMAVPIGKDSGLLEMKQMIVQNDFQDAEQPGKMVEKLGILDEFREHCYKFIDASKMRPLKIVADAGNGMAGKIVPAIFQDLPCEIVSLYFELDGTFPNHQPSPIEAENNQDLMTKVRETGADLGLAFDGDADRVFFVDEKGEMIDSSFITAIVARKMLEKNPGATIIRNVVVSKAVSELVDKMGGKNFLSKVGHSYIKQDMKAQGAIFAGEHSGHYYFAENFRADSGIIAALIVIEMLSESGKKMSELVQEFQTYYRIEETNTRVQDKDAILQQLREKFGANLTQDFDGMTFEFEDWWFNVRPSNTEPLLRLNLEARTSEVRAQKTAEILKIIRASVIPS